MRSVRRSNRGLGCGWSVVLTLFLGAWTAAPPAQAAALPGSYPLTAYQWRLCEKKVSPPTHGEASPCTDAMVKVAYRERQINKAEYEEIGRAHV